MIGPYLAAFAEDLVVEALHRSSISPRKYKGERATKLHETNAELGLQDCTVPSLCEGHRLGCNSLIHGQHVAQRRSCPSFDNSSEIRSSCSVLPSTRNRPNHGWNGSRPWKDRRRSSAEQSRRREPLQSRSRLSNSHRRRCNHRTLRRNGISVHSHRRSQVEIVPENRGDAE